MIIKAIFSLLVLIIATVTCVSQEHTVESKSKDGWINYSSPDGRYSVNLPGQPKLTTQDAQNDSGLKFNQSLATAEGPKALYMIGYFDLGQNIDYDLDKGRDGLVNAVKGSLLSETAVTLGGYPGRAFSVLAKAGDGSEFISQARLYVVKNRVYVVQFLSLTTNVEEAAVVANAKRYFDSFSVTTP